MRQKSGTRKSHGEKVVKAIPRATRKQYSAEEKIKNQMWILPMSIRLRRTVFCEWLI